MKKIIIFGLVFVFILTNIVYASSSFNYLSKGRADTLYCQLGSCSGGGGNGSGLLPTSPWLYNDSMYLYFNETRLNVSINGTGTNLFLRVDGGNNATGNINFEKNITVADTGFFNYIGNAENRVSSIYVKNLETIDYIQFNTSDNCNPGEGNFCYSEEDSSYLLGMRGGVVQQSVGFEFYAGGRTMKNDDIVDIPDCTAVWQSGSTGKIPEIKISGVEMGFRIAQATIGLTTEPIAQNQQGHVTSRGVVNNCPTAGMVEGLSVFLSTNGTFTQEIPTEPNASCFIGTVNYAHATEGQIDVNIICQPILTDLTDVADTQSDTILQFNNDSQVWEQTREPNFDNVSTNCINDINTNASICFINGRIRYTAVKS